MELKISTVFILVCILFATCSAQDSGYIFTSPRSLKFGSNNELQLLRFGNLDEGNVKIRLYYSESYNGNKTLASEKEYELIKGKNETLINYFLEPYDGSVYDGKIEINGTVGGTEFGGSDQVYFSSPKNSILIIQTDKPFYKPGQQVRVRVLKLGKDLKPSLKEDDVGDVYVDGPDGLRFFQFNNLDLGRGLTEVSFQLAEDLVKGSWTITAKAGNETESTTVDVKEYVLPKFDVKIKFPPFVLADAELIPVKVCAEYTYGEPVRGQLNLNLSVEQYSYSYSYPHENKYPVIQESVELDGCFEYMLNVSIIDPTNSYRYRRISVLANIVEEGTGVQRNATQHLSRQFSPLNLNFNVDQNQRQSFKPGLPYNGKVKVTNPDDTPAEGEPIQICYTVTRQRILSGYLGTRKVIYCKNYTSEANGLIEYTIPPQNVDSITILLQAKSIKYARDPSKTGPNKNILNQPQTSMSLSPFFSPSGSFIQLANIDKPVACGTQEPVKLLFTSKDKANFKFYYQIIRQSEIIQTGTKEVSFSFDDNTASKYENDNRLINGSETQLVPDPKQQNLSPSSLLSSSESASDEGCPAARESRYTPPIGEAEFVIDVDPGLSPSFTLLVFYVRDDKETVADSLKFDVQKCFKNKVSLEFGDESKQPGTKTAVKVTASPNSLCGIKAVDKSISLLDNNDQLTSEKVFQLVERMDNGMYYSSNPCNNKTPQPGLYSAGAEAMIRRPPGYSTSSYEDSYSSFQESGFLVISNLHLVTRPCSSSSGGGYGGSGIYHAESFSAPAAGPGMRPSPNVVALASAKRKPASTPSNKHEFSSNSQSTKSAVEVRDFFPETWLFEMETVGPEGEYIAKRTLPHSITKWLGNAVCISPQDGLGISETTSIDGFQAFFISYTLPAKAVRGEEFWIVVSVFNYADGDLPVTVSLDHPEGFEVTSGEISGDICVPKGRSSNYRIKIKGATIGKVNITVRAETAPSGGVCSGTGASSAVAKDAITQSLDIEAEGFPQASVQSVLFCPTNESNQQFSTEYKLDLPKDIVEGSAKGYVDVTGNVLGPAISNLDNLVRLPTGCGEQNMVKFTPNYLVLDYLTSIGNLEDKIKNKAIKNLNSGYQRQLTYRHPDGSYSAFGTVDRTGSMFLTAFVLRSFYEAQRHIPIDKKILTTAQDWIVSKQNEDGCFPDIGRIFTTGLQGGIEREKNPGVTAYVLASLLVSKYENQTVIDRTESCLSGSVLARPYETFLVAYARALAGKQEQANKLITDIKPFAKSEDGLEYYLNPNASKTINIETAAYAVLTELQLGKSAQDVLPLVRYLTKNMKNTGGFYSTQDTVVGLSALSQFASLVYKDPVDLSVEVSGGLDQKVEVSEDNKMVIQRNKVEVPSALTVHATGSGCGLFQSSLLFNTATPPEKMKFNIGVAGSCKGPDCRTKQIAGIVSYLPPGKKAGMSVVKIKMVTGTVPVKDSLIQLTENKKENKILRFDVEENNVVLYFSEVSNTGSTFKFDVEEVVEVENPQAGSAEITEYYAPENSATTTYDFSNKESTDSDSPTSTTSPSEDI